MKTKTYHHLATAIICVLLFCAAAYGQNNSSVIPSSGHSYIHTIVPLEKMTGTSGAGTDRSMHTITYFDGLGRLSQTVQVAASPNGYDIVTPVEYDVFGREAKIYIPYEAYETSTGAYQTYAENNQAKYYNNTPPAGYPRDSRPWSETDFEASPQSRSKQQYGPGIEWRNSERRQMNSYRLNTYDEIPKWEVSSTLIEATGYYSAGTLFVTEATGEDRRKTIEYIDVQGRVVRQRQVVSDTENADTDYAYDEYGQLVAVIPPIVPKLTWFAISPEPSDAWFPKYIYAYRYNGQGLVSEKHIPGAGWTRIVYNKAGNPVLIQDAEQRKLHEWSYTKYDQFGRTVLTGLYKPGTDIWNTVQSSVDGLAMWENRGTFDYGYTRNAFPNDASKCETLTATYYDDYDFDRNNIPDYSHTPAYGYAAGLSTGSKVKVLGSSPEKWLTTVYFYDNRGREIHTIAQQLGPNNAIVEDKTTHTYEFAGWLKASSRQHGSAFTLATANEYDHVGRLIRVKQDIGGGEVTVAENTYNAMGQLVQAKMYKNANDILESVNYTYNIRGWVTGISSTHFSEKLHYHDVVPGLGNSPQWSGNISAAEWQTSSVNNDWHAYSFSYDRLSRLTEGSYKKSATQGSGYGTTGAGLYNEDYTYDMMGNITTLNRWHPRNNVKTQVDKLTFTLAGNQLVGTGDAISFPPSNPLAQTTVTLNTPATAGEQKNCEGFVLNPGFSFTGGTGSSLSLEVDKALCSSEESGYEGNGMYTYDASGRMIKDTNKNIDIQYNHLSLVKEVSQGTKKLRYTYDASGRRLQRTLPDNTLRTYIDGIEYKGNTIDFITTPYGRIRKETGGWTYDYFLKDHLGNIRVVLASGTSTQQIYMATMEESRAEEETQYFENLETTRADRPYNYPDKAPLNTKLAKVPGKSEGPKLTLKVMAGDTINISAQAFYNIDKTLPGQGVDIIPVLGNAMAAMATGGITPLGEAAQLAADLGATASTSVALAQVPPTDTEDESPEPKSGLNFVAYNENFEVLEANTGVLLVDDQINTIQNLSTDKIVIRESGYLEVFVNNEAQTPVFFDNLMVTVSAGNVLEVNAYYPYGKQIVGLSSASINTPNYYKYNGKEVQTAFDLGWLDYGARMLDGPRWFVPDPMIEKHYSWSPYAFSGNNPVNNIDPDGMDWYYFDEDEEGKYTGKVKQDGAHRMVVQSTGKTKEGHEYTKFTFVDFNDPDVDAKGIDNGAITRMEFASNESVEGQIDRSGVKEHSGFFSGYSYANKGSRHGDMDYGNKGANYYGDLQKNTFYIRENIAYNIGDYGNYLWGRGMAELEIDLGNALIGAHVNNLKNGYLSNKDKTSLYDFGPGTYNDPTMFDSPTDQKAIVRGYLSTPKGLNSVKRKFSRLYPLVK